MKCKMAFCTWPFFEMWCVVSVGILRESDLTEGQETKAMLRSYDLDVGKGYPVQASATELFKESRRQNMDQCRQLVVSDQRSRISHARDGSATVEEAKRTVSKLLNEVRVRVHCGKVLVTVEIQWHIRSHECIGLAPF